MIKKTKTCLLTALLLSSYGALAFNDEIKAPEVKWLDHTNIYASLERQLPDLEQAFINTSPADQKDGIQVGTLNLDDTKKEAVMAFANEIADKKHGSYDSMLIAHKGKLVFESYYLRGRTNLPHGQASTTKSYTSLAIGRAVQLGYLSMADLDKPFVDFIKGLDLAKIDDSVEKITIAQLLSMQSGLKLSSESNKEIREEPKLKATFMQSILERATLEKVSFDYKGNDTRLAMQVLDSVVPGSVNDFIKNEVFAKMGIEHYGWGLDLNGTPKGYNGSSMTSRNMLKIGQLISTKGVWQGEQLISADYISKATSRVVSATESWEFKDSSVTDLAYGYYIWRAKLNVDNNSHTAKFAWGGGGQYILTIEDLDLIVVITGHDRDDLILPQVARKLLPAFM